MPRKFRRKTTKRPRRKRRSKRHSNFSSAFSNNRAVIPTKSVKTLRYVDNFTLNPGIDIPTTYTVSCNNLYDPNVTGTGHQPMGFDQLMPLYDHYVGIATKLTVTYTSIDATYIGNAIVGVSIKDSPTVSFESNTHPME
jgi:hypothetical protein